MPRYLAWLKALPGRPTFVGYPAAYDFLFVYWYLIALSAEQRARSRTRRATSRPTPWRCSAARTATPPRRTCRGAGSTRCRTRTGRLTSITTGEGGMLVTRDAALARRAKVMRLHGMSRDAFDRFTAAVPSWYYEIVAPGYKYNLTDIAAARRAAAVEAPAGLPAPAARADLRHVQRGVRRPAARHPAAAARW